MNTSQDIDHGLFEKDNIDDESFLPENLIIRIQGHIPRTLSFNHQNYGSQNDPIMNDLMKLNPHKAEVVTSKSDSPISPESINQYSSKLHELLSILNGKSDMDDTLRSSLENSLFDLTSYIPISSYSNSQNQQSIIYPNETLSKVLIDNYNQLLVFSSNYFNLSLSSHITKYLVELIYSLNYWEVYHLLYLIPDLDYYLKLVNFEVFQTSFGPIVRPPMNYLNDEMLCGLQYPFPYPFYNYSYHSFDPESSKRKLHKIHIKPYIDITLKNVDQEIKKRRKLSTTNEILSSVHYDVSESEERSEMVNKSENNDSSDYNEDESEASDGEKASDSEREDSITKINDDNSKNVDLRIVQQLPNSKSSSTDLSSQAYAAEYKKGKHKSGVIHQCHLVDPSSLRPCLKIFYGKNELLRHQEFVHATKKKIYKCIYCSRNGSKVQSYPRHDSLARHIRRKHGVTGKENKMAVNYAKENVEVIDEPRQTINQPQNLGKPLSHPQFLSPDFSVKSNYTGFSSFSSKDPSKVQSSPSSHISASNLKNRVVDVIELPPITDDLQDQSKDSESAQKEQTKLAEASEEKEKDLIKPISSTEYNFIKENQSKYQDQSQVLQNQSYQAKSNPEEKVYQEMGNRSPHLINQPIPKQQQQDQKQQTQKHQTQHQKQQHKSQSQIHNPQQQPQAQHQTQSQAQHQPQYQVQHQAHHQAQYQVQPQVHHQVQHQHPQIQQVPSFAESYHSLYQSAPSQRQSIPSISSMDLGHGESHISPNMPYSSTPSNLLSPIISQKLPSTSSLKVKPPVVNTHELAGSRENFQKFRLNQPLQSDRHQQMSGSPPLAQTHLMTHSINSHIPIQKLTFPPISQQPSVTPVQQPTHHIFHFEKPAQQAKNKFNTMDISYLNSNNPK